MLKTFHYTLTENPIFENVFTEAGFLLNHVVIEPGKIFPKHPTDAFVYAIVLKGVLSIALEDGSLQTFEPGQVVHIEKGIVSELGNRGDHLVELFVLKVTEK